MTDPQARTDKARTDYVLGHSEREVRRLISQAEILGPITERLLRRAGLKPGMRVLDVGCGAGDVAMLAGGILDGRGSVLGIDRNADVLATARARAEAAGLGGVTFREASLADLSREHASHGGPGGFDLVVARYVLVHQDDVDGFLRAAGLVRPGGCLAFQELVTRMVQFSTPPVPEYDQIPRMLSEGLNAAVRHHDIADRFAQAGLPCPELFCETPIACGPNAVMHAWYAETFRSMVPVMRKVGLEGVDAIDLDTLEDRLRAATERANAQVSMPAQVCAWVRP